MRISAKAEYACVAVLDLALRNSSTEPVRLIEIAQPNGIPERFLVQILLQLKGAGYVQSLRGSSGGYWLSMQAEEIRVWDVIQTIDGPAPPPDDVGHDTIAWKVLRKVWRNVNEQEQEILKQTNFAQLVEQAQQAGGEMYYI